METGIAQRIVEGHLQRKSDTFGNGTYQPGCCNRTAGPVHTRTLADLIDRSLEIIGKQCGWPLLGDVLGDLPVQLNNHPPQPLLGVPHLSQEDLLLGALRLAGVFQASLGFLDRCLQRTVRQHSHHFDHICLGLPHVLGRLAPLLDQSGVASPVHANQQRSQEEPNCGEADDELRPACKTGELRERRQGRHHAKHHSDHFRTERGRVGEHT
jgi:hypothetical protein